MMTRLLLTLLCVTLPSLGWAAVKIDRELTPPNPAVGELVGFTVTIETDAGGVDNPPPFPAVSGVQARGLSTGVETRSTFTNGRFLTKQSRSFTYQLIVGKKGEVTIPALPFKIDGYTHRTQPLTFTVSGERPPNRRGRGAGGGSGVPPDLFDQLDSQTDRLDQMEEIFNQMLQRPLGQPRPTPGRPGSRVNPDGVEQKPTNPDDAFFIQATTDKRKAYVGEQITANFYLVTRGQVRDIDTLRYPDLKGFWKEDLEMATRLNFEPIVIDGVQYQRALLVAYALFPIHAGKAVLDGYRAKCTVLTPSAFGFGRAYQFTKESQPIEIEVLDPPAPKPDDFTGAVGQYRTQASFEPPTGSVNQPITLRVRFEGQGNAKLIELPKLKLPEGFEIYETKSQAKFAKDGSSHKDFEVLIIPRQPGRFHVAPVAISVFDPQTKAYVSAASAPLEISVTGRATTPDPTGPDGVDGAPKSAPEPSGPKLPDLAGERGTPPFARSTLWILTAVAYALSLVAIGALIYRAVKRRPRKASLAALVRARVARTRALAAQRQWRRVGVELTNGVYLILGHLSEQGGASHELERLLERTPPSVRSELGQSLKDLLARCETLSFAPNATVANLAETKQVDGLIADFESTIGRAIELAEI